MVKFSDYLQGLPYAQKALAINESILPTDHPDLAITYYNLAIIYQHLESLEKAHTYMQKAMMIWERSLPPDPTNLFSCTVSQNSGVVLAKAAPRRIAISGVTLCLPLMMADKVLRVVPKPVATSATVSFLPVSSKMPSSVSRMSARGRTKP